MTQTLQVWAPRPKKVEVLINDRKLPARKLENGWWEANLDGQELSGNHRYGFILDDKGPFPDPRSAWQPEDELGLSRFVDHGAFSWTDDRWQAPPLGSALIYEVHIGTFTQEGTFDAAIGKLDYLRNLGVTHIEIMPVNGYPGSRNWGYDGVNLFAAHHAYGGPEGFKRLVDACHARSLAVILDVVYNHLGPPGAFLAEYGPYFSERYATAWGKALNFDGPDSSEVRRFFCDNALMWLRDYHVDGLRIDAVHAIFDFSAKPFLEQLSQEVKRLGNQLRRHYVLIAESDLNDPRILWPPQCGGFGLDAQWSDDFHHSLHTVLTGEHTGYYGDFGSLAHLAKALENAYVYVGGHSKNRQRPHGRTPTGLDGWHFLCYLQNHDQIGNRARGERTSHLLSPGKLKIGAALVLTAPFIPMLFQGEEWAASTPFLFFSDHKDPGMGKLVTEGRRKEFETFGWRAEEIADPQAIETFNRSKLKWSELAEPAHAEILEWHRALIQLRRTEPSLADGSLEAVQTRYNEERQWLVVQREPVTIVCNFGNESRQIELDGNPSTVLLSSNPSTALNGNLMELGAESVAIVKETQVKTAR